MSLIDRAAKKKPSQPKPRPAQAKSVSPRLHPEPSDAPDAPKSRRSVVSEASKVRAPAVERSRGLPDAQKATGRAPNQRGSKSREFAIDFERLKKFGFITPTARRSRVSEEFRLIKRRLMQRMTLSATKANGRHGRGREHVILVTSARPSEGKSFIAVNLALSIILDEKLNVMLVDADVARPSISRIFGLRSDLAGITDLLLDQSRGLPDVLLRAQDQPLSLLTAGGAVASATDLFSGGAMRTFVTDVSSRYTDRIIIFDAPPLLASTEPVALAEHAGQTVLVIDADKTSRSAVDSALDLLETDENVNLVLNKTTIRGRTEQFGSYYDAYNQPGS